MRGSRFAAVAIDHGAGGQLVVDAQGIASESPLGPTTLVAYHLRESAAHAREGEARIREASATLRERDLRSAETQATAGRRAGNALLNWVAGYLAGRRIPDLTSGFRGARREYLREFLHLLPNGFSTPTTTTLAFIKAGYNVTFVPIEAQTRVGHSKIRLSRDGMGFLMILLRVITIFSPLKIFLPISLASFLLGAGYAVYTIIDERHVTNSSVLLITLAVIVFLVGLVSEQISAMRSEGKA